jgi:hypothetical protein
MYRTKLSSSLLSILAVPLLAGLTLLPLTPAFGVTFQPKGSPDKTAGGGSRGMCVREAKLSLGESLEASDPDATPTKAIAALIPATNGELTASAYPTILVKIAESESLQAEFTLWDENLKGIYQTTLTLTDQPGIVSVKLPADAPPLEIGKRYKWSVAAICDSAERQRDVVVQGWLQRAQISSSLSSQIETAEPLDRVKLYAENGFWYDTVATLAELKRSLPDDTRVAAEWQELLNSVGLTEFSQVALLNCCQAQN